MNRIACWSSCGAVSVVSNGICDRIPVSININITVEGIVKARRTWIYNRRSVCNTQSAWSLSVPTEEFISHFSRGSETGICWMKVNICIWRCVYIECIVHACMELVIIELNRNIRSYINRNIYRLACGNRFERMNLSCSADCCWEYRCWTAHCIAADIVCRSKRRLSLRIAYRKNVERACCRRSTAESERLGQRTVCNRNTVNCLCICRIICLCNTVKLYWIWRALSWISALCRVCDKIGNEVTADILCEGVKLPFKCRIVLVHALLIIIGIADRADTGNRSVCVQCRKSRRAFAHCICEASVLSNAARTGKIWNRRSNREWVICQCGVAVVRTDKAACVCAAADAWSVVIRIGNNNLPINFAEKTAGIFRFIAYRSNTSVVSVAVEALGHINLYSSFLCP